MAISVADDRWGSAWAWHGATAGSTCWLAISALVLAWHGKAIVAATLALCYLVPLAVALRAWSRRDATPVSAAWEAWFVVAWLAAIIATAAVHLSDTHAIINLPGDAIWLMWIALLVGGSLLWFSIRRRRRGADGGWAEALFHVFASWF